MTTTQARSTTARIARALLLGAALFTGACGGGPGSPVTLRSAGERSGTQLAEGTGRSTVETTGHTPESGGDVGPDTSGSTTPDVTCRTVCANATACGLEGEHCAEECIAYAQQHSPACFAAAIEVSSCLIGMACNGVTGSDAAKACGRAVKLPPGCED